VGDEVEPLPVCMAEHPEFGRCFIDGDREHGGQDYHESECGSWPMTAWEKSRRREAEHDREEAEIGAGQVRLLRAAAALASDGLPPRLARLVQHEFEQWIPEGKPRRVMAPPQVFGDARHVLKWCNPARKTLREEWNGKPLL